MRVQVKQAAVGGQALLVPELLGESWPKQVVVRFGQRRAVAEVIVVPDELDASRSGAWRLEAGAGLIGRLLLQTGLQYEMEYQAGELWLGPVIGLVLGEQSYIYHDSNMGEFTDAMAFYEHTGGLVTAFRLSSVDWERECVYGLYYDAVNERWSYGMFPLPTVVHLRAFQLDEAGLAKLKRATGGLVFNSVRYDKWELYERLWDDPALQDHLPETRLVSELKVVEEFLNRYPRVILKPRGLSRARGILILERMEGRQVRVIDYTGGKGKRIYALPGGQLSGLLKRNGVLTGAYIVQPRLDLAAINGSPFDIRVVMQKNARRVWQCTGIECRHAGKNHWITNISRGGQALEIRQAVRMSFGYGVDAAQFEAEVVQLAERFVHAMEGTEEHFAEFGLDVAVDAEQRLWLLEANVRPSFQGFRQMEAGLYQQVCGTPLLYAAALAHAKRWEV